MATKDVEKRRQQWRSWYERNKNNPEHRKRVKDFDNQRRKKLHEWVLEIKSEMGCKKCGVKHPAVLDFHHRDPAEKVCEVSTMGHRSLSKKKILEEIAKCDVYCANCHRILHWEEKQKVP